MIEGGELPLVNYPAIHISFLRGSCTAELPVASLACRRTIGGESCDGISSEPPVGVVSGDAQIFDRHCAPGTAARRNKGDNSYYAF